MLWADLSLDEVLVLMRLIFDSIVGMFFYVWLPIAAIGMLWYCGGALLGIW